MMIYTDYPRELTQKVVTAIKMSLTQCRNNEERWIAGCSIVEFLTAMDFTAEESISVLKRADGDDAETDEYLDKIIKEFESEIKAA